MSKTAPSQEKMIFTNIALDLSTVEVAEDRFQVWAQSSNGSKGLLATLSTNLPQVPICVEFQGPEAIEFYLEAPSRRPGTVYIAFHTADEIIRVLKMP